MNNQLAGFGYDAAGNMTSNGSATYFYDAENRLLWTSGERYVYDGDGNRVEKCAAATLSTLCPTSGTNGALYWRGTGSDTLDETDLSGNPTEEYIFFNGQRIARRDVTSTGATVAIHYYFSDQVGSHSVVENATGTATEQDVDYYPYGGIENDYCTACVAQRYKFTGKERDSESGLDNFGKRYFGSSLGRFQTPDPIGIMKQKLVDPQQWNMYAYVRNNPLRFVDPTGMYTTECSNDVKKCSKKFDHVDKQRQKDLRSKDIKVRQAAAAWGERGVDNGVHVKIETQKEISSEAGDTGNQRTDAITTPGGKGNQPNISVQLSQDLGGSDLGRVIAHEGSHIEDDVAFIHSYNPATGKYNGALNPTHFSTEFQGFEAGSAVKPYDMFRSGPKGYQELEDYIYKTYTNPPADDVVFPPSMFPQE